MFANIRVLKLAIKFKAPKTFKLFFKTVSVTERRIAKRADPSGERNCPDTFCFILMFRMDRSEALSQQLDNASYPNLFIIPTFVVNKTLSDVYI
ncbi:MAG: hypothetical protein JJE45_07620 [Prolixibacteraceae bacterium]|nr:hypothetical protein [Prolixibacteraceae bacterium]